MSYRNGKIEEMKRKVLYSKEEADFLSEREKEWKLHDREKVDLILSQIGNTDSFLEIGCGSGQILKEIVKRVSCVVGVDESPDRLKHAAKICEKAKLVASKAEELAFKEEFDAVLTSQMLHEVKMFCTQKEMDRILFVIKRALKPRGKYLFLDHLDPGEGSVEIEVPDCMETLLLEFSSKFRYRPIHLVKLGEGIYEIEKRDLQDFVSKTWSFNTPMENMEMNETHASFSQLEAENMIKKAGFSVNRFISFTNIEEDLKLHQISLKLPTLPWNRKFMLVALKTQNCK